MRNLSGTRSPLHHLHQPRLTSIKPVEPRIIQLPKILDPRGNLSFIEQEQHIPFSIERTYWIYDVPGGEIRGGHAYWSLQEFIVALSGSFDVVLHNGQEEFRFHLNRSYNGLYVPRMYWRSMENFSTNSVALVLADKAYNEEEYIRDFNVFQTTRKNNAQRF
ncbi:MAG: WxcM-like domain-containing protein [Chitinophagaceae bacterium]|nr:WxcM-like domain-containing protein [Chitinophagaceae bacterium]